LKYIPAAHTPEHYRLFVVFNPQHEEHTMTKPNQRIKRVLIYSTCALTFSAISGVVNAHVCMKKSYGQGYMTPMHPHHMQGIPAR